MNLLEKAAAYAGRIKAAYDAPLLQRALDVDGLGRTLPMQFTGDAARWLGGEDGKWAARVRGQVWRVNNFFATTAAGLPFALYQKGPDGKKQRIDSHEILDLLYQPNPDEGQSMFFHGVATDLKGSGNCFISSINPEFGSRAGKPGELWRLPLLNVEPMGGGPMTPVEFYRYTPDLSKPGTYYDLSREQVLHLKQHNPAGGKYGLGCIVAANREATLDESSITAQVAQLQNMGPRGVLWFEPVDNRPPELGPTVVPDLRARLGRKFTGPHNAGQFPIMTNKVGWTQIGVSAVDLDILNARRANFADLCGYWMVPSLLLGDKEGTTFNNLGEARKMLYTQGIVPHNAYIAFELSRWLVPNWDSTWWLEPDTSGVPELQEDKKANAEWLALCPFIRVERKAEIMGEAPDPNFTGYLLPAALVHVQNPNAQAVPAAPDDAEAQAEAAAKWLARQSVTDYQ